MNWQCLTHADIKDKIFQCKAGSAKLHEFAEYYLGTRHKRQRTGPGIYIPDCTWQVCLTSKCFPAWSEARGLKSARLSRIGYCTWCESLCSALRPAIREPGSRPLRYRAVPRRMNESKKTKKLSDGFSSYINEDKAADILFKVQLMYMTNHSLLRN